MYCNKCGKQISYEAVECNECREEAERHERFLNYNGNLPYELPRYGSDMSVGCEKPLTKSGLGAAIAALALSFISLIALASLMMVVAMNGEDGAMWGALVFSLMSASSIVFSVFAIKAFRRRVAYGQKKPILSLIFGLVSMSMAIETLAVFPFLLLFYLTI